MLNELSHPHLSIQYDWQSILRNSGEKAWIVCSEEGCSNIYSDVICKVDSEEEKIKALDVSTEGLHAEILPGNNLRLKYKTTTSHMISPKSSFKDIHRKAIGSLNISPGGSLGVSSSEDGALYVWQSEDGKLRRTLDGHISEVTHCKFFPSGMVVLSGGVDMRLKIWSVEDGSCPVTLLGHKAAITDTNIVDRGRNIISCGRDGAVHLWDCSTASSICKLEDDDGTNNVINACDLSSHQWQSETVVERSEKECGTEGKLLVLAKENGTLKAIDVHSRDKVFDMSFESSLNSCCFINEYRVVAGQQNGNLAVVDIRNSREAEFVLKHGKSPINCVKTYYKDRVLVGRNDGACSCLSLDNPKDSKEHNLITQELIGSNHDPIYDISFSNNTVYTACRDGVVRKYCIDVTSSPSSF